MKNERGGNEATKATKLLIVVSAALLVLGLGGTALAFHEGGVAHCDGCHSMHNSADNPVEGTANGQLMKGSDASSTCLNCHAGAGSGGSYHIFSADATVLSPGGDFFWLTQDYSVNLGWTVKAYDPMAISYAKQAITRGLDLSLEQGLELEAALGARLLTMPIKP